MVVICTICKGSGWTGWHKPYPDGRGGTRMVFIPQLCRCAAGDAAADQYEKNLKAGRAGRDNGAVTDG